MGYIQDSLSDGEEVRELFKLHWFAKSWMILWIILAIPTIGITLLFALWEWLKLRSIEQGVTRNASFSSGALLEVETEEMKITSIETVEIIQGVMGRIFGYGDMEPPGVGLVIFYSRKLTIRWTKKKNRECLGGLCSLIRCGA